MRRLALTLAVCVLLSAGCGEDETSGRTVTVPANGSVEIVGREYSFDPSTVVVRGAGRLTLTLRNEGSLAHNLKVFRGDQELGGTPSFPGGERRSARVNLEHGAYELICTVADHEELGMTGTLRVR